MGKRCRQYAVASLHKDPTRAFTQSTDNAERFLAGQEFVNSNVKSLIKSLYTNPKVDKDRIPMILRNQDTVEEIKRSINKTTECCNFPAFIQSCGVKDPNSHIEKMIKTSIAGISTYLKEYSKTKRTLTASRIGSYFQKYPLHIDAQSLLKDVDTKSKFQPVSRRATLLPPIRPPVTRPSGVGAKMTRIAAAAPKVVKKASPKLVEIDEVPALQDIEQEPDLVDLDDIPQLVAAKVEEIPSLVPVQSTPSKPVITIAAKKKSLKYFLALTLLEKSLQGDYLKNILAKKATNFTFFCPNDDVLKSLNAQLNEYNSNINDASDLIVSSHLMMEVGEGEYENVDGTKFMLILGGKAIQEEVSRRIYKIHTRSERKPYPTLNGTIRYMVLGELIEKAGKS